MDTLCAETPLTWQRGRQAAGPAWQTCSSQALTGPPIKECSVWTRVSNFLPCSVLGFDNYPPAPWLPRLAQGPGPPLLFSAFQSKNCSASGCEVWVPILRWLLSSLTGSQMPLRTESCDLSLPSWKIKSSRKNVSLPIPLPLPPLLPPPPLCLRPLLRWRHLRDGSSQDFLRDSLFHSPLPSVYTDCGKVGSYLISSFFYLSSLLF